MKGDKLIMSQKERSRKALLSSVQRGEISLFSASEYLGLSYRQSKRIWKRYKEEKDKGLIHRSRGRPSKRAYDASFKERVLRLYEEKYQGFGPTFAKEKLYEMEQIKLSEETLRRWLLESGLWQRQRKSQKHRSRRARRAKFGELLQIDGSIHDWFGKGKKDCLLNIVDDATGTTLSQLDTGETTRVLFKVLWLWIARYGVPQAVYVDLKSVYISPKADHWSAFQAACARLNIKIIKAYSPQAKGRVERSHGVYQDRLVKEIKLRKIETIEEANRYLLEDYLDAVNAKFAKAPSDETNGHRNLKSYGSLKEMLCWHHERQVQQDYTIRFENKFYQIMKNQGIRAKSKITVRVYLDGSIGLWCLDRPLQMKEIKERLKHQPDKKVYTPLQRSMQAKRNRSKSPWSTFNPHWLKAKKDIEAGHEMATSS